MTNEEIKLAAYAAFEKVKNAVLTITFWVFIAHLCLDGLGLAIHIKQKAALAAINARQKDEMSLYAEKLALAQSQTKEQKNRAEKAIIESKKNEAKLNETISNFSRLDIAGMVDDLRRNGIPVELRDK